MALVLDMQVSSFENLLDNLQKRAGRDPRRVRLASVVSAIQDVIRREELEVTPARVYARILVTLEGCIQRKYDEVDQLLDSMYTQVALLELLGSVLPFLEASTIAATFVPTGRALCSLLDFVTTLDADMALEGILKTKDDMGVVPSTLCAVCTASSILFQCVSKVGNVDDKIVRRLFRNTLRVLLSDGSDRVRLTAKKNVGALLRMEDPRCHNAILIDINEQIIESLNSISATEYPAQRCGEIMSILDLTRSYVMQLNFEVIGERLMYVLVGLFAKLSPHDNSVSKVKDSSAVILAVNILLSTVLEMLDSGNNSKAIYEYAGRVLATLLQVRPTLIISGADLESSSACCELLAQLLLAATKHLFHDDYTKASMLLPLTINHLFTLATEAEKLKQDVSNVAGWFSTLTQILEGDLLGICVEDPGVHAKCCESCLKASKPILGLKHRWLYEGPLECLAVLLLQTNAQGEAVTDNIRTLISMRENSEPGTHISLAFDKAISRLVQGYGIEKLWERIDFKNLCVSGASPNGFSWLVRIMRQYGPLSDTQASLLFFQEEIIPLARRFDVMANECEKDTVVRKQQAVEFWSLFPTFCVFPRDVVTSLPKLAPVLVRAMKDKRYPQLLIHISVGIAVLANGVLERASKLAELVEEAAYAPHREEVEMMKSFSEKILPTLFKMVDDLYCLQQQDDNLESGQQQSLGSDLIATQADALTDAITALSKVTPSHLLQNLFTKVIHRVLEASQSTDDQSDKMCSLLALSQALYTSQCLNESSVTLMYRALRPLIGTDETQPRVQKRSYKLLAELCKSKDFVMADGRLNELVDLLTSSTATSQVSARSMRLRCLEAITVSLQGSALVEQWILSSLLGEMLLCLKDSNKRTRDASSGLLMSLSRDYIDPCNLIQAITGCLASETSHMKSAAVLALSKLLHEHGKKDPSVQALIPSLLQTILLLSDDPSREVIRSVIVFVRVAVAASPPEVMRPLVPTLLDSVLKYHRGMDRFRGKIKIVMKKLVRLFGSDYIIHLVAETDSHVLAYLKKLSKVEEKAKKVRRLRVKSEMKTVDEMMASDEEDNDDEGFDDEDDVDVNQSNQATGKRGRLGREHPAQGTGRGSQQQNRILIRNDVSGTKLEVRDLVDKVTIGDANEDDDDSDDDINFDEHGRLVVTLDEPEEHQEGRTNVVKKDKLDSERPEGIQVPGRQRGQNHKGRKLGDAYKARKAGGDVRKKGQKFDPYAYVPLDGRSYTKKNRRNAVEQLHAVVRGRKRQKK